MGGEKRKRRREETRGKKRNGEVSKGKELKRKKGE